MFDRTLKFTGKHADYLRSLAPSRISGENYLQRRTPFMANIDILVVAPLIGFAYGKKASKDVNKEITDNNVFLDQVQKIQEQLTLNFKIIMLLENGEKLDVQTRIDRAFKFETDTEKMKPLEEVYWDYTRGGIEILYERLIQNSGNPEEDIQNMFEFVEESTNIIRKTKIEDILEA